MFFTPGLVFGGIEGVRSRFNVLRPDSFSAVPRGSGHVFMFCAPGLIFDGTEGVGSRFQVVLPDSFLAVQRASGPVFMFCAPGLVFGGTDGVGSRFHVLRARTHFRRYRGRRVPFSCFARSNSFSAVPRASGPVFMFYVLRLIFGGVECVGSRFHVLRARSHFLRNRGRVVRFLYFVRPDSFSSVPRASGPVFMFCAPGLVFGCTEGVGCRLHVCATFFRALRTAASGDEMRKKDTEIPPKRAFV
jgi:hypothetical protein